MVCDNHFKTKYVRFLIKYHLLIFVGTLIMASLCLTWCVLQREQIQIERLSRGFQAHGTTISDNYRTLIALLRETQTGHLYPKPSTSQAQSQQVPYPSFEAHIDPCSERFYLPSCPIVSYIELTWTSDDRSKSLLDDMNTFREICHLESNLRARFSNASLSTNESTCQWIGPVTLLFDGHCNELTSSQWEEYRQEWIACNSSSAAAATTCSNHALQHYLTYLNSPWTFKIYLSAENDPQREKNVIELYKYLHRFQEIRQFQLLDWKFDSTDEEILFFHLFRSNLPYLCLTIGLYLLCLLFFVKNLFFVVVVLLHTFLCLAASSMIYVHLFHFPLTLLNASSITLYLFVVLIDSFLWYTCWFVNDHRRDDCTINRTIENLLTQIFYYLVPKNLAAIIALVMTYTSQIIALQCFIVFSVLLLVTSFLVSFTLYPVSFIFLLRYHSSIPTLQRCFHRVTFTAKATSCFLDRTIPYLIVRLKVFWLTLFTLLTCIGLTIIFHWPQLHYNICRITFDALPKPFVGVSSARANPSMSQSIDIDVTYYMGSNWEVPTDSIIPSHDIPVLDYNAENKMSSPPGTLTRFVDVLEQNLTQLIDFCSQLTSSQRPTTVEHSPVPYRHYHRRIANYLSQTESATERVLPVKSPKLLSSPLTIKRAQCFGDLSLVHSPLSSSSSSTKFSPIVLDPSLNCAEMCSSNQTSNARHDCLLCLNTLFYQSQPFDDLFVLKNGLRFISDSSSPHYLLQTIHYQWNLSRTLNQFDQWQSLLKTLRNNVPGKFYAKTFQPMSIWWSSEVFATYSIMEQLEPEKSLRVCVKVLLIAVFLLLFTGTLGLFVTVTILFNFISTMAILTLFNFRLTVENMAHFTVVLIICSQYSVLYSMSYKLAPTFFFQRENRTLYSLKQLCSTLFHVTCSILLLCSPCLFSSLPYLSKSALIFTVASLVSLLFSTLFLQSLLCLLGPAGQECCLLPWQCQCTRHSTSQQNKSTDVTMRKSSKGSRRHQRMSTSSHFASSYFSQIFTGSTYFESEYGGVNEALVMSSRRRESSRSHQAAYAVKRASLLTGEVIELYTPRASLAPYGHHLRYSRQSSVSRGVPTTGPVRPLYISPSVSPHSQLSIHSHVAARQPSPSRSPSPHSFARGTNRSPTAGSLRPCYSAPRLHVPLHRMQTGNLKPSNTLSVETSLSPIRSPERSLMTIQRQDAVSSTDDLEQTESSPNGHLSAAMRRSLLKSTTMEAGGTVWLKRSNSS